MKRRPVMIIILMAACILAGLIVLPRIIKPDAGREKLIITDLDVGKADAAVVMLGDSTGIIDTGLDDSYDTIAGFLNENKIEKLDFILLTHYDKDHIGSAVELIESIPAERIYLPDYVSEKKLYSPLMDCVADRDGVIFVNKITDFSFGAAGITVYPADDPAPLLSNEKNRDNDMSLVNMITYGNCRMLFTGDIENSRIEQILDADHDISCDWIKIPHHGHYDKKDKALLKKSAPLYAVVSTSEDVLDEELVELLEDRDIKTYYTFNGNISTVCDGRDITLTQEEHPDKDL